MRCGAEPGWLGRSTTPAGSRPCARGAEAGYTPTVMATFAFPRIGLTTPPGPESGSENITTRLALGQRLSTAAESSPPTWEALGAEMLDRFRGALRELADG